MKSKLECDTDYLNTFHSPGIEYWITGFLKSRKYDSAIDVGCGLGFMSFILKIYLDNVNYLVGLDISRESVFKAKKMRLYDDLIVADARSLPFRSKSFDLALSIGIPAYFNIEGILKREGNIVLEFPSLPKEIKVKDLLERGYRLYKYLLRSLILVELNNYRVLLTYNKRSLKAIKLSINFLKFILKVTSFLERGNILAFK